MRQGRMAVRLRGSGAYIIHCSRTVSLSDRGSSAASQYRDKGWSARRLRRHRRAGQRMHVRAADPDHRSDFYHVATVSQNDVWLSVRRGRTRVQRVPRAGRTLRRAHLTSSPSQARRALACPASRPSAPPTSGLKVARRQPRSYLLIATPPVHDGFSGGGGLCVVTRLAPTVRSTPHNFVLLRGRGESHHQACVAVHHLAHGQAGEDRSSRSMPGRPSAACGHYRRGSSEEPAPAAISPTQRLLYTPRTGTARPGRPTCRPTRPVIPSLISPAVSARADGTVWAVGYELPHGEQRQPVRPWLRRALERVQLAESVQLRLLHERLQCHRRHRPQRMDHRRRRPDPDPLAITCISAAGPVTAGRPGQSKPSQSGYPGIASQNYLTSVSARGGTAWLPGGFSEPEARRTRWSTFAATANRQLLVIGRGSVLAKRPLLPRAPRVRT